MVREDINWSNLKKMPADSLARIFLGSKKRRWDMLGVVQNRAGQQLLKSASDWIFVPTVCRPDVLEAIDSAHNVITRALDFAVRSFWWEGMRDDIAAKCKRCLSCIALSDHANKERSLISPTSPHPDSSMAADFLMVPEGHDSKKKIKWFPLACMLTGWLITFCFDKPPTTKFCK